MMRRLWQLTRNVGRCALRGYRQRINMARDVSLGTILLCLGIRTASQRLYDPSQPLWKKALELARPKRLYSLAVMGSLCVLPWAHFRLLLHKFESETFINFVAESVLPVQYLLAIVYFGSNHFDWFYLKHDNKLDRATGQIHIKIIASAHRPDPGPGAPGAPCAPSPAGPAGDDLNDLNDLNKFENLLRNPCRVNLHILGALIMATQIMLITGSLVATDRPAESPRRYVFFVISRIFGWGTCILNTFAFAFVYYKHIKVINIYASLLEHLRWESQGKNAVSELLLNLIKLRESLQTSTRCLRDMFSSATICGVVITAMYMHTVSIGEHSLKYDTVIFLGSFTLLQVIMFSVIGKLDTSKERIEDVARGAGFAEKFLKRKHDPSVTTSVWETGSTLDYFVIIDLLKEEWVDMKIMGIRFSIQFVKKGITFIMLFMLFWKQGVDVSEFIDSVDT